MVSVASRSTAIAWAISRPFQGYNLPISYNSYNGTKAMPKGHVRRLPSTPAEHFSFCAGTPEGAGITPHTVATSADQAAPFSDRGPPLTPRCLSCIAP